MQHKSYGVIGLLGQIQSGWIWSKIIGVLVFNLIMYILIKKGNKNPANKEQVEKRVPLDFRTKRILKITFFFAY